MTRLDLATPRHPRARLLHPTDPAIWGTLSRPGYARTNGGGGVRCARRGALAAVLLLAATLVPLGVLPQPGDCRGSSLSAAQSLVEVTYSDFLDVPPNPNSLAYWSAACGCRLLVAGVVRGVRG